MVYQVSEISKKEEKDKTDLLSSILTYIKKPYYDIEFSRKSFWKKFSDILHFLSLAVFLAFILGVLASFVMNKLGYDTSQNSVVDLFNESSIYFFIFLALIWAPFSEEIGFRLALRYSPLRLSLALSFISLFIISLIAEFYEPFYNFLLNCFESLSFIASVFIFLVYIITFTVSLSFALNKYFNRKKTEDFYRNNFAIIFYSVVFVFGFIHILNFNNFGNFWYVSFLLFLPQLSASFILSYVRMKYGFSWSVAGHFLYNFIFSIPLLLFSIFPESVLEAETIDKSVIESLPGKQQFLLSIFSLFLVFLFSLIVFLFLRLLYFYFKKT